MSRFLALVPAALLGLAASSAFAAGDVTAVLAAKGELQLTGDDLANDVQIDRDPATKEFVVLGRSGTTVNGAAEFRATGVVTIRAAMNGGDDVLALGGFFVKKNVVVDMGDGNDTFSLYHMKVRGRVVVHGGAGDDTVKVEGGSDLLGGGLLDTADGTDHVVVSDSYVRGAMRIVTGDGDDHVEVLRCGFTSSASLSVRTGAGADVVDYLGCTFQCPVETLTYSGVDTVNVTTSRFVKSVGMNAGDDDDNVNVERSTFDARFFVSGGNGTNNVFLIGINLGPNGSNVTAGGFYHSGHWFIAWAIVHVFP